MTTRPEYEKDSALLFVTVVISGDRVQPLFWTQYFSVNPSISTTKGEYFTTRSGKLSRRPARTGSWICSSKDVVKSNLVGDHLEYFIDLLKLPRLDLKDKLVNFEARLLFSIYFANYTEKTVPLVEDKHKTVVEASGGIIVLDEFPQKHSLEGEGGLEHDFWV